MQTIPARWKYLVKKRYRSGGFMTRSFVRYTIATTYAAKVVESDETDHVVRAEVMRWATGETVKTFERKEAAS